MLERYVNELGYDEKVKESFQQITQNVQAFEMFEKLEPDEPSWIFVSELRTRYSDEQQHDKSVEAS